MELSGQATLSKFTDYFMLIAFLRGSFLECAGRALNSAVGALSVTPTAQFTPGKISLEDSEFPSGVCVPIRPDQRDSVI